ncbi:MAG: murein L,D-transpeptidase catalytic domain family protein [Candidatus Berkiella sp.]
MRSSHLLKVNRLTNFGKWLFIALLCINSSMLLAKTSVKASQDVKVSEKSQAKSSTRSQTTTASATTPAQSTSVKATDGLKGINPKVLGLALKAEQKAKAMGIPRKPFLTVIDYSLPSTSRRLWVIDMSRRKVLHHVHVAHGSGTGDNHARHFSDAHGSHKSSLGLFLTGSTYQGKHGTSLTLHGLEKGFNGNAASRAIVMHPAGYVKDVGGRLGRSWGCPAISYANASIIQTIKDGSLIFAYYPDNKWLSSSRFL